MKAKKLQQNSRAANLLQNIGHSIDDLYLGLSRPGLVVRFGTDGARDFLNRREQILQRQAIKRLEQRKLIKIHKITEKYHISLTKAGIEECIRLKIADCNTLPEGSVCMIAFDIPEIKRPLRQKIRRTLSRLKFVQLQKSVWISKKDAASIIAKLFKIRGQEKWVRVFTAREI